MGKSVLLGVSGEVKCGVVFFNSGFMGYLLRQQRCLKFVMGFLSLAAEDILGFGHFDGSAM